MAHILLTYDIDSRHAAVKEAMLKLGYSDSIVGSPSGKTYYLPNTTLHINKAEATSTSAKTDLQGVIMALNGSGFAKNKIKLERLIAVPFETFVGIPGEEHKS
jgi:hypothetical protein